MSRCSVWLPRKGRYCGGAGLPGSSYCGNHQPSKDRVACPLDPSHTVSNAKVDSHVLKCPVAKLMQSLKQCPYYSPGLNGGSDEEDNETSRSNRETIESLPNDELEKLVKKIKVAHASFAPLEDSFVRPEACCHWLTSQVDRRHPLQEKHIVQQAAMLGNLEQFGLLTRRGVRSKEGTNESFIEFGAGRGYLSHMLSDCYAAHNVVLVERRSYKFKADRTLRYATDVSLTRLRVDIEDLRLDAVEALEGCTSLVAVGKHLCGAATDLTLRCVVGTAAPGVGVGFATCCHHLCRWKSYVNKDYFRSLGFSKFEFEAISWLTSWAVSGGEWDERAELGLKCKELVDMGRVAWLQQKGMRAKMVRYVAAQTSPENRLIMAARGL